MMKPLPGLLFLLCFAGMTPFAQAGYVALEDIQTVGDGSYSFNGCFDQTTPISGACSMSHADQAYSFGANVFSSGDSSGLHAYAAASISSTSSGYMIATAQEVLADTLTFGAPLHTNGYVSMTLTTDGIASGGNTPGYIPNAPPGVGYGSSSLALNSYNSCSFYNSGHCTVVLAVDFFNPLNISVNLSANAFPSVDIGSDSQLADFQNTGFISNLQFTDAAGNPMPLSYTSSSGLTYPMSPVPETATLTLMLSGILMLTLTATRRWR